MKKDPPELKHKNLLRNNPVKELEPATFSLVH